MNHSTSAKNPPLKIQIPLGIAFAFLNLGLHFLNRFNPVPLYADSLFTVSAAFFGLTSGLICSVLLPFPQLFAASSNHTLLLPFPFVPLYSESLS